MGIEYSLGVHSPGGVTQDFHPEISSFVSEPRGVPDADAVVVGDGRARADQRSR